MSEQPWLPGLEGASEPTDRLFFAIFPDDAAARRTAQLARHLKSKYRLQGEPLRTKRFHVSLYHLGDYFGFPEDVAARAIDATSAITMPPFEIAFDRVMDFSGRYADIERQDRHPFVLLARDGVPELMGLRQALATVTRKAGLRWNGRTHFTPHMTLLYDERRGSEETVETIRWTVREFVLIHSLLGQTQYALLGRWPISGRYPVRSTDPTAGEGAARRIVSKA
jgi:RNA 2',3'-cyclic 3'-phosphodiesterase